ncbi:MAG: hypothetical protein KGH93_00385 [Patescibacteria group bacterium]|nr:hypothetical protein [Patescibacteria group bacterium]MDE1945647.1 hypothetical protein [Patescibacteria group bacterium]
MRNFPKIILHSLLIAVIGVMGIDYVSHLLFSNPMETLPYFLTKMALYFVFSILFLSFFDKGGKSLWRTLVAGIIVSLAWGFYYNILPVIMDDLFNIDFYPFGIALKGLTFLGMGLFGTGLAFGIVHTLAFVGGYYIGGWLIGAFR